MDYFGYDIVEGKNTAELAEQVRFAILKGWRPTGGVHTAYVPIRFYQAMVREQQND